MISQSVEYSLRAMVVLWQCDAPLTVSDIAARGNTPAPYLAKLMRGMKRADLIMSKRGLGGGFLLASPSNEIRLTMDR